MKNEKISLSQSSSILLSSSDLVNTNTFFTESLGEKFFVDNLDTVSLFDSLDIINIETINSSEYNEELNARRRKASTAEDNLYMNYDYTPDNCRERQEIDLIYRRINIIKNDKFKYVGEVRNGMRDGFGICYYVKGEIHMGQWKEDKKESIGKTIFLDGEIHQGEMKDNQYEGYCEIINEKKHLYIQGFAKEGKFVEEVNINLEKAIISLSNDKIGKLQFSDNIYYMGEIKLSQPHILGILVQKNNKVIMGEFNPQNFCSDGYAEIYCNDSCKFYGYFKNNIKNGLGLYMYKDGKLIFGKFENDIKNGPFFYLNKNSSAIKIELYHLGFKSKVVEKYDNLKKYLILYYPEFSFILNFDYKNIIDKLWELKDEQEFIDEIKCN